MVTVKSTIQIGIKLVNRNKKLVIIPLVWELTRALLFIYGFSLGVPWQVQEPSFFIKFVVPTSWPTIDQILPVPLLSPGFLHLFNGRLWGSEVFYLGAVLCYAFIDSIAKGWFLTILRDVFTGKKIQFNLAFINSIQYLNQYFILRLLMLVGILCVAVVSQKISYLPQGFWDLIIAIGGILLTFVDLVILFRHDVMPRAIISGVKFLSIIGQQGLLFLIWGAVITATLSVPLNYAVSFFPAFLLAIAVYVYAGVILSTGLMYVYTTSLLSHKEKL